LTHAGDRLRALAARLCSAATMERLIDPILADLRMEYREAVRHGRAWRSRWVRIAGYGGFLKAIAVYAGGRSMQSLRNWPADDRRGLGRTLGFSGAATAVATLLLMAPPLVNSPSLTSLATVVFVIPQALALAVPVGFTLGILCALGCRAVSGRLTGAVVVMAILCSIASLVTVAWIMPAGNQAFRVSRGGGNPAKGIPELTLGELGSLLEPGAHEPMLLLQPHEMRSVAVAYHTRWSLSFATLVLALFALTVVTRRPVGRVLLALAGCGAYLGYYLLLVVGTDWGRDGTLSAFAAAWLPNVVFVVASAAVLMTVTPRSRVST
jgi:hypothetical protein